MLRPTAAFMFVGLLTCPAQTAQAQNCATPVANVSVRVVKQMGGVPQPVTSETPLVIELDANDDIKTAPKPEDFGITLEPGGTTVDGSAAISRVTCCREEKRRITLELNALPGFDPGKHTDLRITIKNLVLQCGTVNPDLKKNIIMTREQARTEWERINGLLESAEAVGTAADQRNIYAGFAAVKGEGGAGQGAADIVINERFLKAERKAGAIFDSADIKLLVKKSTGANADPRSYTAGVEMTKAFLWGGARQARIAGSRIAEAQQQRIALLAGPREAPPSPMVTNAARLANGAGWFRGIVINEFLKMEGDAFDFKTVNFVTDTQAALPSIAKPLGRCTPSPCIAPGFFTFRVLGGPEVGRNMHNPADPATATVAGAATGATTDAATGTGKAVDYIFRTKAGVDMTLRYGRSGTRPSDFAVELDLAYVNRWLHRAEPVMQDIVSDGKTIQERVTIQKGTRPWRQADLKLFLFGNEKARYGIKFSFYSGSLPPSFAKTRALQIGIVIQTNDQKSDGSATSH